MHKLKRLEHNNFSKEGIYVQSNINTFNKLVVSYFLRLKTQKLSGENARKMCTRITPNTDTFHAVQILCTKIYSA